MVTIRVVRTSSASTKRRLKSAPPSSMGKLKPSSSVLVSSKSCIPGELARKELATSTVNKSCVPLEVLSSFEKVSHLAHPQHPAKYEPPWMEWFSMYRPKKVRR